MTSRSFDDILNLINDKINTLNKDFVYFKESNENKFESSDLNLLYEINLSIDIIQKKIEELTLNLLEKKEILSIEEELRIKENKINEKIMKLFLPYILYAKICLSV